MSVTNFDLNFDVTSEMSPRFHIVVYFITDVEHGISQPQRPNMEVIGDSILLNVEKCFHNKVSLYNVIKTKNNL